MKTTLTAALAGSFALSIFTAQPTHAQQGQVKVDVGKIEISMQKTPRFEIDSGTKDKRDEQGTWIEIEVPFQAKMAGRDDYINELQFDYFVMFDARDKSGKRLLYTATVNHVNIPKDENTYSVVYVSPVSLQKIFGKGKGPKSTDVIVAVEVKSLGTLVGGEATKSASSKWWREPNLQRVSEVVLNKKQTPFAPLWWDRYPEIRQRNN